MEVLVTFDSAMTHNDNGFVAFPEVIRTDEDFAEYMDAIGKKSIFVMYNIYMTDMNDDVVNFINKSFRGSFLFRKSEVMNRWFLITPFSKTSWKNEHVIVKDEKMKEFLIKESESGNADNSIVIPSFPSQDVN